MKNIAHYRCRLVRTGSHAVKHPASYTEQAKQLAKLLLSAEPAEVFAIAMLDTQNRLIGTSTITTGTLSSTLVHAREVFRPAILANANAIILLHNHPHGSSVPSPEDWDVFNTLRAAGELLAIKVLDSMIVGDKTVSMVELEARQRKRGKPA